MSYLNVCFPKGAFTLSASCSKNKKDQRTMYAFAIAIAQCKQTLMLEAFLFADISFGLRWSPRRNLGMYVSLWEPQQWTFDNDLSSNYFVAWSFDAFVIHLLFHLHLAYQKYKTVFIVNRNQRVRTLLSPQQLFFWFFLGFITWLAHFNALVIRSTL